MPLGPLLFASAVSSPLFQQVAEATRGEYVLGATLGESDALGTAFLAREVATGRSVALVVPPDAESLDVVGALSDGIPADAGGCAACGFRVGTWVDACPRCEHSLLPPPGPSPEAAVLADQLRGSLDVLGGVPHVRGGTMYFGREMSDGRLTAFVVRPQGDGQLALEVVWEVASEAAHAAPTRSAAGGAPEAGVNGGEMRDDVFDQSPAPVVERLSEPEMVPADRGSRRWLPIGLGVGALALVGAGAFALTHRNEPARVAVVPADTSSHLALNPPIESVQPTSPRATVAPGDSQAAVAPPLTPAEQAHRDSINAVRRRARDSVRAARAATAAAGAAGLLTIEGDLPTGWTATVNGAGASNARELRIAPNTPALIRLQAPGYCADTLRVQLGPQARQHWSPSLRGRSIVEEC